MTIPNRYRVTVLALAMVLAASLLTLVVVVGLRAGPAQAQSSGDTECAGTLPPGVYDGNVVVPPGASCTLLSVQVKGNILVREGGILTLQFSTVLGDVKAVADGVSIDVEGNNTILGNVVVLRNSDLALLRNGLQGTSPDGAPLGLRGDVRAGQNSTILAADIIILGNVVGDKTSQVVVISSTVGKNIVLKEGTGAGALICGTTVEEGNIEIKKLQSDDLLVGDEELCARNFGGGNLVLKGGIKVSGNTITGELGVDQNSVPEGNIQVFKNTGEGTKTVQFNEVGKNLQCFENSPPFVGGPNVAQKAAGQCFATPPAP
jgi:hypothetical protein